MSPPSHLYAHGVFVGREKEGACPMLIIKVWYLKDKLFLKGRVNDSAKGLLILEFY